MNLNINSPAYFSQQFGVDDGVYWMCRELSEYVKDNTYSNCIDTIGIVPIVAPKVEIDKGLWSETRECQKKYRFATVCLQIDYEEYLKADEEKRKKMIIENVLKSVKVIRKRGEIDYKKFETDIINFCKLKEVDMDI